jgi:hypothetical protein
VNNLKIEVKCYSGYRGEETPRSIFLHDKKIQVEKILDMWLAPDHRYFKFFGSDKGIYIIRYDTERCVWELTFYKEKRTNGIK